jgi:hypothetical protein
MTMYFPAETVGGGSREKPATTIFTCKTFSSNLFLCLSNIDLFRFRSLGSHEHIYRIMQSNFGLLSGSRIIRSGNVDSVTE